MHPVLLVHGIYDIPARFYLMRRAMLKSGFPAVHAMSIRPADASISLEAMGEQVKVAALRLLHSTGAGKLDVVAYSMGALAARYFIQRLGGNEIVRRYISLSGPHHGTLSAYFNPLIGVQQMRPDNQFLRDLNADRASWGDVEVHSFWTHLDLVVLPASSSILDWAHNRDFWVPLHPFMLTDRKVISAIISTLKEA